jgi:hypothetical protein
MKHASSDFDSESGDPSKASNNPDPKLSKALLNIFNQERLSPISLDTFSKHLHTRGARPAQMQDFLLKNVYKSMADSNNCGILLNEKRFIPKIYNMADLFTQSERPKLLHILPAVFEKTYLEESHIYRRRSLLNVQHYYNIIHKGH